MSARRWQGYWSVTALLTVTYYLRPGLHVLLWGFFGLSAFAAIVIGTRRNQPSRPLAWYLLAAGVLSFITGDLIYKTSNELLHVEPSFPSYIDLLYLAMYPLLTAGLLLLVRARSAGRDNAGLVDALLITTGLALLSWVFLIVPYVREADLSLLERLVSMAYPLGDVLVLSVLARLWTAGGLRSPAARLLGIGAVAILVTDSLYVFMQSHGTWSDGGPVDIGWIIFYSCWGAAALHPSMRTLSEFGPPASTRMTRFRFVLLAAAALMAPAALVLEAWLRQPIDVGAVAGGSAVLILLVLARMAGFVQVHREGMARERAIRRAGASLVAAAGRERIQAAAVDAVLDLAGPDAGVGVALALGEAPALEVVATSEGLQELVGGRLDVAALPPATASQLREGRVVRIAAGAPAASRPLIAPPGSGTLLLCPIKAHDRLSAVVMVTGAEGLQREFGPSMETLGSQIALTLARAVLAEDLMQRQSEARFRSLVQNASDIIMILRGDLTASYVTPSVERVLGYEPEQLDGVPLTALMHADDVGRALAVHDEAVRRSGTSATIECRVRHHDDSWHDVELVYNSLVHDPNVTGTVLTIRDITERKKLEEELKHQAFHDSLTALANRALFRDRVEHALARGTRQDMAIAVLFVDLDDFKVVNDSLGHAAGDQLLIAVADRLRSCLRTGDTAARLGGDEFAVLVEGVTEAGEAAQLAERIIAALATPFHLEGKEITVGASIGYAVNESGTMSADELLRAADVAMYAAKADGKGGYEAYEPTLHAKAVDRLERTIEFQRALDAGQFVLYYQPIVSLAGGQLTGVEALVRWQHPHHGLLSPSEFIPLAEETGLIVPLGQWVLEQACQQAATWHREHPTQPPLRMSVNLSARQFHQPDLTARVAKAIEQAQLDPATLVLELTETLLLRDTDAMVARIRELKDLGVKLAIDDFGTGYSSLSYLKHLPVDILKVDKSFIDGITAGSEDSAVANAIVSLGRVLQLQTVAEGVEEASQSRHLQELGYNFGQGYFYAKPIQAAGIAELLERSSSDTRAVPAGG